MSAAYLWLSSIKFMTFFVEARICSTLSPYLSAFSNVWSISLSVLWHWRLTKLAQKSFFFWSRLISLAGFRRCPSYRGDNKVTASFFLMDYCRWYWDNSLPSCAFSFIAKLRGSIFLKLRIVYYVAALKQTLSFSSSTDREEPVRNPVRPE